MKKPNKNNYMQIIFSLISILFFSCNIQADNKTKNNISSIKESINVLPAVIKDTVVKPTAYENITYQSLSKITAGSGTKSVVFNSSMTKLYAMNLEGMSVLEIDQKTKKIIRSFKFKATPGTGWDYDKNIPINSFEEKPVEAYITNSDSVLWVSLHNAEGIVPIFLHQGNVNAHSKINESDKLIYVKDSSNKIYDSIYVPIIKTGKTPKVITGTSDNKTLLVSNWHSYNISVLQVDITKYPFAQVIATIPVSSIPRGMVINEKAKKTFVAIMGGASLAEIDNTTWKYSKDIQVAANPRHLVQDDSGRIFVSYNKISQIACIDPNTGATLFSANTSIQPRSIAISKNKKFLFVTCYNGNKVDVFKIKKDGFELINELDCPGNPVGVDIFEDNNKLEAWVCSYEGIITIFSYNKSNQ